MVKGSAIRTINLIILIVSVIFSAMSLSVASHGDYVTNGLSASKYELGLGERFELYINVPPAEKLEERHYADTLWVKVTYDPDVVDILTYPNSIELVDVPENKYTITESYKPEGGSYFSFAVSSDSYNLATKNGLTLKAICEVKKTTKSSTAHFNLADYGLAYTDNSAEPFAIVDMWKTCPAADLWLTIPENIIPEVKTIGGLSLTPSTAYTGGIFTANITVPGLSKFVDAAHITLEYYPQYFELISTSVGKSGMTVSSDIYNGRVDYKSEGTSIDLTGGTVLSATFRVKKGGFYGDYPFKLIRSDLEYRGHALWNPSSISAMLKVLNGDGVFPNGDGGIKLSTAYTSPGTDFDVYITVPVTDATAETVNILTEFSGKAFTVESWDLPSSYLNLSYGDGYFEITAKNASIDLCAGLSIRVHMNTKSYASIGKYSFRLSKYSVGSSQLDYVLWTPSNISTEISVLSEPAAVTRDPAVTITNEVTNPPEVTPRVTVSNADTTKTVTYDNNEYYDSSEIYDPDDEDSYYNDGDGIYDPDDEDSYYNDGDGIYDPDDEDDRSNDSYDTTKPANKDVHVYIDPNVSEINNRSISALTKKEFFGGDVIIMLRNTDSAANNARTALQALGRSSDKAYALDISIYDVERAAYLHYISGGFVDFKIPVPSSLSGYSSIDVYHTDNGSPERISSSIVNENGVRKLSFRGYSFSSYMFVASGSGNAQQGGYTQIMTGGNNGNNGGFNYVGDTSAPTDSSKGDSQQSSTRPANPHTGYILIGLVPVSAAACVILARKEKKRHRCTKR